MENLSLEQLNWELALAYLDDTIRYLQEYQERLEKASCNLKELDWSQQNDDN